MSEGYLLLSGLVVGLVRRHEFCRSNDIRLLPVDKLFDRAGTQIFVLRACNNLLMCKQIHRSKTKHTQNTYPLHDLGLVCIRSTQPRYGTRVEVKPQVRVPAQPTICGTQSLPVDRLECA